MTISSTVNVAENIFGVLHAFNWFKVGFIYCSDCYGGDEGHASQNMGNITSFLEKRDIEITISRDLSDHKNGPINFTAELENFSSKTRIIVALLGNNLADYTDYLQAMNSLGYKTDEYCSILILSQYNYNNVSLPWTNQEGENQSELVKLFHGNVVLYNNYYARDSDKQVDKLTEFLTDEGLPYDLNTMVYTHLYESMWMYNAYKIYAFDNEDLSIANLTKAVDDTPGPFGLYIQLNNNTQRIAEFSVAIINASLPEVQYFKKLGNLNLSPTCKDGSPCLTFQLDKSSYQPIEQMPVCGFHGEHCDQMTTVMIIAILVAVALVAATLFYVCRKMRSAETAAMPWAIAYDKIKFIHLDNSAIGSVKLESDDSGTRELASLDQNIVYAEKYHLRERLTFDKTEWNILFEMKQSQHDNINTFFGLCFEKSNDILFTIWSQCFRGTLEEVIFTKQQESGISFDENFRGAFVRDILKALEYLHSSNVYYHGSLTPNQCLIDSHWILKLTGFGMTRLLCRWRNNSIISTFGGKPLIPNRDLHYYAPELRKQLRTLVYGNRSDAFLLPPRLGQHADMYSFGVILYEILFRERTFVELPDVPVGEDENAIVCEQAEDLIPPHPEFSKDTSKAHPDTISLIQKCFSEQPELRPDAGLARKITDATLKMTGSLVDQMMKNMEQYTTGLEKLVEERTSQLDEEQKRADGLLMELLPRSVAEELKVGRRVNAKNYKSCTVLYSDIVGFTALCSESKPMEVVALLSGMYQNFDLIIGEHEGYKIETIGDAYCVASGIPSPSKSEHVKNIATIALLQREFLYDFEIPHREGRYLHCRWGFNTGPVFTGVVGIKAPRYCVFGPTVSIAAKMESSGQPDKIQMGLRSHQGIGTLLTNWLDGVEDLLKSDRSVYAKALSTIETADPLSFPKEVTNPTSESSPQLQFLLEENSESAISGVEEGGHRELEHAEEAL
ncbi:hypothetical protein WR25_20697 isoform C [Diploscapter pachys]|uniref:guanylate cyclase n=1 Tax=Diploscapter pachys TaxID=2018661 RepID=A0A2A2J5K2_9BILA|nr:hypothetical protein WR25_20697 isoform C [Diploscapter pachys]